MPDTLDYSTYLLFPAFISVLPSGIAVNFPDVPEASFDAFSFEEALGRAETELYKAIHSKRVISRREGRNYKMIKPTSFAEAAKIATEEGCYLHMVAISEESITVYTKKSISVPAWLCKLAERDNLNLSAILARGIAMELGLTNNLELSEARRKFQE